MTENKTVQARRVGMLTPSSNTVLEPYTSQLFSPFGEQGSVHFSRFKVTEISLSSNSVGQFNEDVILQAALRLAEANVHCIAWNGTSAAWLGLEKDIALCARVSAETGIPATSTMLAFDNAVRQLGAGSIALITPYLSEIQDKIITNYQARGFKVVYDKRLEDPGNFSFANYTAEQIKEFAIEAASAAPDVILIVCTNFRGATVAEEVEQLTGIPVLDSVSVTAWQTMHCVGLDPGTVKGWGKLFKLPASV